MGVDIYAAIVQWDHFTSIVNGTGTDALWDIFEIGPSPTFEVHDAARFYPPLDTDSWYATCVFRGAGALGSYSPHGWLAVVWNSVGDRADMSADLVALCDRFFGRLLGPGVDFADLVSPSGLRVDTVDSALHMACSPAEVAGLARLWRAIAGRLEELRPVMTAEIADISGWTTDFDGYATLIRDWGEIVEGAEKRAWGLFFLLQ
ncbi:hypothetical protein ABZ412_34730 [Nocardia sp. NPDC005746]|uniref:hypothetical protein n=1 Tax=Nocardia sp. NPDC005746 TaxID=3157062 RepID=UPI0033ECCFB3